MFKQLVYVLFLVVLVILSVFVIAENITGDELDNSSMINYTNNSVSELPYVSDGDSLISTILSMTLDKMSFTKGEIMSISVKLTTADNIPISNEDVYFFLDANPIGDSPTNSDGVATAYFDTSTTAPGQYMVSADYHGSTQYNLGVDYVSIEIVGDADELIIDAPILTEQLVQEESTIPTLDTIDPDIKFTNDCVQETWIETIPVYKKCTGAYEQKVCLDYPINTTCYMENVLYEYDCLSSYENIEKNSEVCKIHSYLVKDKYRLDVDGYICDSSKDSESVTMICDSIYDGNGDGICTSGESCMKFVVKKDSVNSYVKNSQDEFALEDKSYFLNTASATEVSQ